MRERGKENVYSELLSESEEGVQRTRTVQREGHTDLREKLQYTGVVLLASQQLWLVIVELPARRGEPIHAHAFMHMHAHTCTHTLQS